MQQRKNKRKKKKMEDKKEVVLSKNQQLFLKEVEDGKNVFLTGKAGTGKTFIVKKIIEQMKEQKRKFIAIAPTGVAANNLGGQTIHSLFQLTPFGILEFKNCSFIRNEKRKLLAAVSTIFIDEVSMLRPDVLDAINWTLIKNGCEGLDRKQIVFIGDLKQLPAPLDDNTRSVLFQTYEGEEFFNAKIYEQMKVKHIELDEVLRQSNEEFISNLNIIREGGKSEYFRRFKGDDLKGIVLAPHNATVAKYNIEGLAKLDSKEFTFKAKVIGNAKAEDFNLESVITVKNGAKIMYLVNSKNNSLINGTLGTFLNEGKKNFIEVRGVKYALELVEVTKKEYVLDEKTNSLELKEIGTITQIPIKLAYALSIHKAQGLTFDEVTVDLTRPCFQRGQLYVALSRVTAPEGLRIISK